MDEIMEPSFYQNRLYPFQDAVIDVIKSLDTEFYLSGGTALSRGFLNHRYSDDLDFFVNDDERFSLWADRYFHALSGVDQWSCMVVQREERYFRLNLQMENIELKIEMINDVPSRVGEPWNHEVLGRMDTAENLLANKITAILDRRAPKDFADIWGLCCLLKISLQDAIAGVQGKAAGVFPIDLARVLCSITQTDWELVRWIEAPNPEKYIEQLNGLGKNLILLS